MVVHVDSRIAPQTSLTVQEALIAHESSQTSPGIQDMNIISTVLKLLLPYGIIPSKGRKNQN
jgi:hypothetical protein